MEFGVFIHIFCLETTAREKNWMRTTSVTVMAIFFESVILKVQSSLINSFERHLTIDDFMGMD